MHEGRAKQLMSPSVSRYVTIGARNRAVPRRAPTTFTANRGVVDGDVLPVVHCLAVVGGRVASAIAT